MEKKDSYLIYFVISAIAGIIICIYLILYATTLWEEFDWLTRTLSNLGNPLKCPRSAPILNGAYVLGGMSVMPFNFYILKKTWMNTNENFAKLALIFLYLSSILVIALGFFTEMTDYHLTVSTSFFISFELSLLFMFFSWIVRKKTRKYAIVNIIIFLIIGGIWLINSTIPDATGIKFWSHDAIPEFTSVLSIFGAYLNLIIKELRENLIKKKFSNRIE
ncbi:MAG: DUF998 domain-containing protein [Promethearchaeota archaeon]